MTFLTVNEVANYLKVPVSTVYRYWKQLGGVKIGRYIRIAQETIDEHLMAQRSLVFEGTPPKRTGTGYHEKSNYRRCLREITPEEVRAKIDEVRRLFRTERRT